MQNWRTINSSKSLLRTFNFQRCCKQKRNVWQYRLEKPITSNGITLATNLFDRRLNETGLNFCISSSLNSESEDFLVYEKACEETLETLTEYFEEIVEKNAHLSNADVAYSDGVLTVNLGKEYGTYVINRQTPNRQIWLSSPFSGPKRYDFINEGGGYWYYKHDGKTLHQLLQEEISKIAKTKVDFSKCTHSKL